MKTREAAPAPEIRAGERVYREIPDRRSSQDQFRNEMVGRSDDAVDAVGNIYTIVRDGLGVTRPTGQHSAVPRGDYADPDQSGAGSPDPVVGLIAGVAMATEAARAARTRGRKRRAKKDGDG